MPYFLLKSFCYEACLVFLDGPISLALNLKHPRGANGTLSSWQFGRSKYAAKLHQAQPGTNRLTPMHLIRTINGIFKRRWLKQFSTFRLRWHLLAKRLEMWCSGQPNHCVCILRLDWLESLIAVLLDATRSHPVQLLLPSRLHDEQKMSVDVPSYGCLNNCACQLA